MKLPTLEQRVRAALRAALEVLGRPQAQQHVRPLPTGQSDPGFTSAGARTCEVSLHPPWSTAGLRVESWQVVGMFPQPARRVSSYCLAAQAMHSIRPSRSENTRA